MSLAGVSPRDADSAEPEGPENPAVDPVQLGDVSSLDVELSDHAEGKGLRDEAGITGF